MSRLNHCFAGSALALFAGQAAAQTATSVDELVVTGTRLPTLESQAPGVRVITAGEIEQRQAVFAADLLDTVPGVSMRRNGALGGLSGVRIRGAASDQTLVVIDGVPLNDPSDPSGGYDFAHLDLAGVERVEILSGPQGAAWGSDAIGGVVALTTRELDGWRASLEGGSLNTARATAAVGVSEDRYALGATASGVSTSGISKAAVGTEDDAYGAFTAGAYGRVEAAPGLSLDGRIRYNQARAETDGYAPPFFVFGDTNDVAHSQSWSGHLRAAYDGFGLRQEATFAAYRIERDSVGGGGNYAFSGDRRLWRYTVERGQPAGPWAVLAGVEREETAATLSTGGKADLNGAAAFAVARARPIERLTLTGAVRFDDPSAYGSKLTGRAAGVLDLGGGFAVKASWGQGYKTPSISQIACDFCFPKVPALGLKPEAAEGYDLGLAWRSADGRFSAAVTGFHLAMRDQITWVFDPATFASTYVNLERTRSSGVELDAAANLGRGFAVRAGYAWIDAEDAVTGAWLLRAPHHQGSATISWRGERLSGAFTVRAEGEQADSDPGAFSPAIRPGFITADIAAAYQVRPGLTLTARVENLLEADYQQSLGYSEPGISAFIGVRLSSE
ncbi:MAG: TonB-dependent receptor plug domain-containing protein [Caulobacteraceae bacterium]